MHLIYIEHSSFTPELINISWEGACSSPSFPLTTHWIIPIKIWAKINRAMERDYFYSHLFHNLIEPVINKLAWCEKASYHIRSLTTQLNIVGNNTTLFNFFPSFFFGFFKHFGGNYSLQLLKTELTRNLTPPQFNQISNS